LGDPVNNRDRHGTELEECDEGDCGDDDDDGVVWANPCIAIVWGVPSYVCGNSFWYSGVSQVGGGSGGSSIWSVAENRLTAGLGLLIGVLGGTPPTQLCQTDLNTLSSNFGISAAAIVSVLVGETFNNGSLATGTAEVDLFDASLDPNDYAYWSQHPGLSVASQMGAGKSTQVQTALPGSPLAGNMYFNPSYVNSLSTQTVAGLLMHEALHALGQLDPAIEAAFGLNPPSNSITQKFTKDCFGYTAGQ
jgi:hypothetical protein